VVERNERETTWGGDAGDGETGSGPREGVAEEEMQERKTLAVDQGRRQWKLVYCSGGLRRACSD
jgi:hypothetical protein